MPEQLQPPEITHQEIERALIMEALCESDAGVALLKWICRLSGWNRPTQNMEDAVRRDFWHTLRRFIPAQKLPDIELEDLRNQQALMREIQQQMIAATQNIGEPSNE